MLLSVLHEATHRNDRALECAREAVELERAESVECAVAMNHLAGLLLRYSPVEEHDKATNLHDQAMRVMRAALGSDHPTVATALNNHALDLKMRGKLGEALDKYRGAVEVWSRALGPKDAVVAVGWSNMGVVLRRLGRVQEALAAFRRALAIDEARAPPSARSFDPHASTRGSTTTSTTSTTTTMDEMAPTLEDNEPSTRAIIADVASDLMSVATTLQLLSHSLPFDAANEAQTEARKLADRSLVLVVRSVGGQADHPKAKAFRRAWERASSSSPSS